MQALGELTGKRITILMSEHRGRTLHQPYVARGSVREIHEPKAPAEVGADRTPQTGICLMDI